MPTLKSPLLRATDTKVYPLPGGSTCHLYPSLEGAGQTIAYVEDKGRYPEKGYSYNTVCSETLFVISGQLTVTIESRVYQLGPRDLICIEPKQKYYTEGQAEIVVLVTPCWDPKQNQILPE